MHLFSAAISVYKITANSATAYFFCNGRLCNESYLNYILRSDYFQFVTVHSLKSALLNNSDYFLT